jgi:hypothetical protein
MKSINFQSVISTHKYAIHTDMWNILLKLFVYLFIYMLPSLFHLFCFALHKMSLQIFNTFFGCLKSCMEFYECSFMRSVPDKSHVILSTLYYINYLYKDYFFRILIIFEKNGRDGINRQTTSPREKKTLWYLT